jgi:ATP-binding cassette subfamily B protein
MQAETGQTIKIFWRHAQKYRVLLLVITLFNFAVLGVNIYTPQLYSRLVDTLAGTKPEDGTAVAVQLIIAILAFNFLGSLSRRAINLANNHFLSHVEADLTNTCFAYLQHHSYNFFTSKFVGSLVTKVKRYEKAMEVIVQQIVYHLGRTLLEAILTTIVLLWLYPLFGYIMLGWSIVYLTFSYFYARFRLKYDLERSRSDTRTTAHLADAITNNVNVKAFTSYQREEVEFQAVTADQMRKRGKAWFLGTMGDVIQGSSMVITEFIVMYYAIAAWQRGELTVGALVLLQAYFLRLFDKLWDAGSNIRAVYESLADANEMTELLMKPHGVQDAPGARELIVSKGAVTFKDATFGYYHESSVLKNFNLSIAAGERVALVGPSGGGKSTILKLIMRFYDLQSGQILIDGQDIATATQDSVRSALSLVPQDPILFHRSLAENIRYAKPEATDEEVIAAARLAHAHEFIEKSQHGYQTLVGERGIKLSGGERQRIAIARALLKNAPILILDEATSSLDSESEILIQDALHTLMAGRTTIVVAHRLSTIMQMDRIVVIAGGGILEEGTHDELLKAHQGTYQKLWNIQAGGFTAEPVAP